MVAVVEVTKLVFAWTKESPVIDIAKFRVDAGERVFLRGPSGSGKSTLLSIVAGVVAPDSGSVSLLGQDLTRLSPGKRDALRADALGVIFQLFNLVPYLTVAENIALPCRFSSARRVRAIARGGSIEQETRRLLGRLGLGEAAMLRRKVGELSVGQQQRVAAARALVGSPSLIIADEPTSALDSDARAAFIDLLSEECAAVGASLLFVSHDRSLAASFDRQIDLSDINRVPTAAA